MRIRAEVGPVPNDGFQSGTWGRADISLGEGLTSASADISALEVLFELPDCCRTLMTEPRQLRACSRRSARQRQIPMFAERAAARYDQDRGCVLIGSSCGGSS
jgi:hypothetical protein